MVRKVAFSFKRRLYEALPISVKRTICLVPFRYLAGHNYREFFQLGLKYDEASRDELNFHRDFHLKKMLEFAVAQVPAYKKHRSAVEKYQPMDALKDFPLLDKETLQADMDRYLPLGFNRIPHYETTTGGTSGNQLKIYLDDSSQSIEMAFMHRQWARVGYTPRCRKATFRGVPFPNLKNGVFWQHNPVYNELQFSPFHMSEENLSGYLDQIVRFKPSYFHGYPSALDVLAEFVIRHGLKGRLPKIKAALCGSEGLTAVQRERIQHAFGTRVYSWYGHSERVILAGECEVGSSYHHFPDYGALEIINEQGHSCNEEGERGELVGTGFLNRCMPLIRYRTGDYATRLRPSCLCGRSWERFTDVEGRRKQEMLHGFGGVRFSLAAINMHGNLFDKVKRFQYVQHEPGHCRVDIMVAPSFSDEDKRVIENAYRQKVGESLQFAVNIVNDIPLTPRGKLKMLVSNLN